MPGFATLDLAGMKIGVTPGSAVNYQPRVLKASFGNRYVQRSGDGFNANPRQFEVKFTNLTVAEADAIIAFLDGCKGYIPFYCRLPRVGAILQWTCEKYRRDYVDAKADAVSATFEENFDA